MANQYLQDGIKHGVKGAVCIFGKINIGAGGAVSSFDINLVQSVTKSGVGEYTILLKQGYVKHISSQATLISSANIDLVPQIKSVDVVSAKTVIVKTMTAAAPADAASACELDILIVVQNSMVAV